MKEMQFDVKLGKACVFINPLNAICISKAGLNNE